MLVCQGSSFYFNFIDKKGHNSRNKAFRVMPFVLQLHLVMMSKYSSLVWATLKLLHDNDNNDDDLMITIVLSFSSKQTSEILKEANLHTHKKDQL